MMIKNGIKAIVTGVTGMVGEGVVHECLLDERVEKVLVVGRKPCGITHPKLSEVILDDFFNPETIADQLKGYNTCYFCLGVTSIGKDEATYTRFTYDLTIGFSKLISKLNTHMVMCYVSGGGTDSTEKGRLMWARVKGKTENDLMKLPFAHVFAFRPGYMHPTPGLQNTNPYYKYIQWMYPLFRILFKGSAGTLAELGRAMIRVTVHGYERQVIEVKDIRILSQMS